MKIAFISVLTSSNDLSRCKMLNLSIRIQNDGILTEHNSLIKPVAALSKMERSVLPFEYLLLRTAPPLCDVTPIISELLEGAQTVFCDRFSERIFIKSFREIGYPMGSATYILEKIFKQLFKSSTIFSLPYALEILDLEKTISNNQEAAKAMQMVYYKLEELGKLPHVLSQKENVSSNIGGLDFSHLPPHPGVYFFRDLNGTVIYVGKAKNILQRVRSHFTSKLSFERHLCKNTETIDFEDTGSETIALLLESHYISDLKPTFNTQQKALLDPYIIASKIDSKGVLRIQPIQKSYSDSENDFYYNRDSVLKKIMEVQQKFKLCKRYTGIERKSGKCSDPIFCKGICQGLESKEEYNLRVKNALQYIDEQRPSYILKLKGRNAFESAFVLIKHGIYQGFGFIDIESQINSIEDINGFIRKLPHTYFTSRIIDQYFKSSKNTENVFLI
ncbi:nucleotide excision repair endonuclease [Aequorivita sp. H23M31]|uniref:Nucleotide excision repair endonuclease n=1 Tax=Aequorivita ciconiae TaxID=2494375 RepID=A0A410G739_9FLAO|nr:GIY-YIG nuclease family protein [Aequorivita sp. H23M31]QAA83097.1 nucleotide excision repair endonuclease [Aequorivita sp. H23M31]